MIMWKYKWAPMGKIFATMLGCKHWERWTIPCWRQRQSKQWQSNFSSTAHLNCHDSIYLLQILLWSFGGSVLGRIPEGSLSHIPTSMKSFFIYCFALVTRLRVPTGQGLDLFYVFLEWLPCSKHWMFDEGLLTKSISECTWVIYISLTNNFAHITTVTKLSILLESNGNFMNSTIEGDLWGGIFIKYWAYLVSAKSKQLAKRIETTATN